MRTIEVIDSNGKPLPLTVYSSGKVLAVTRNGSRLEYDITHLATGYYAASFYTLADARKVMRLLETRADVFSGIETEVRIGNGLKPIHYRAAKAVLDACDEAGVVLQNRTRCEVWLEQQDDIKRRQRYVKRRREDHDDGD